LLGVRDDSGSEPFSQDDDPEPQPTPAERLLYALGQLYRRWHNGELPVRPHDFDVWELATTIGVKRDIEMVVEHPHAVAYHFPGEVLVMTNDRFPWAILNIETWSAWCDLEELSQDFWA
jgi:hypothetical protein